MVKIYPNQMGRAFVCLTAAVLLVVSSRAQKMVTYDTTFGGWNAIVTEDVALSGTDSAAGIVFFPGIGQMTTNVADLSVNGPHYLINNGMWDGSVPLANGVHHPFIISLQPPSSGQEASVVLPKIQAILARYRIKRNSFYMTGLSCGGWQANEFVAYEPTPGNNSAGMLVKAIVNLEGVEPADSTPLYPSESYPRKMGHWAKTCGGRELWVEGSQDWRDMLAGAQDMTDSVAGSATYFQVTYGGGAHCCWNTEYEPSVTWTTASNSNISQVVGAQVPMNVWQWLLRQGDTSMPKNESASQPAGTAPTVTAESGQTITLPVSSVNLTGTATGNGGATIAAVTWKQGSGPATATIGSANSLSATASGMTVAGSYVFTLTAIDNNGNSSTASVTITVNAAAGTASPTVSAGKGQVITLPVSTVSLVGTAAGNGGATIVAVSWAEESGPVTATFSAARGLYNTVSGMTVAGSYVFTLTATDNNGNSSNASITVTVNAAAGTASPPTVSAGQGQMITLPVSTVSLAGTAAGNGGATIVSVSWVEESGPVTATLSTTRGLYTTVSGMTVAGSYVFTLSATDNNGNTSNASMTVTVDPATATVATATAATATTGTPTVSAGPNQTITLPTSSVTLSGSVSANGDVISSYNWLLMSGPSWVKYSNEFATSTTVTEMVQGTYVFELSVTDINGVVSNSAPVSVVVNAAAATATGTSAITGQAAFLTDSAATDDSALTGQVGSVQIYPNPVRGLLNLRLNNSSTGKVVMAVFDLRGTRVRTVELDKESVELDSSLDLSSLTPGMYLIEVFNGQNKRTIVKVIKQ